MLFLSALAIGMVAGLQNVTTEVLVTDGAVTEEVTTVSPEELASPTTTKPTSNPEYPGVNMTTYGPYVTSNVQANFCPIYHRIHHVFYQIGNLFLLVSFLIPHTPKGLVYMRLGLVLGSAFGAAWGWFVECYIDIVFWNILFVVINSVYFVVYSYLLRPIKFQKDIEEVYAALFKPLRVSRRQFRRVVKCMRNIKHLKCQELYAHEKVTKVDSLSLVLSGKLVVSQNQRALHIVFPHHFLDSPEWFGVSTDEYFQVSIMAMEESRVLVWHRDKLKLSIMSDGFLQAVFDHILGRDVVHKLMQVSETMAVSNGHLPNSFEEGEDKPMLVVKKAGDGPGITALLNRQLQASDPNAWRLGRIEETDHETAV